MSGSEETRAQSLEPPEENTLHQPNERQHVFSKLSGGGVGTFVVWLANHLNWSDDWKTITYGAAPWIALFVSWLGPIATAFTVNLGSYVRAKIFLRELDRLSNSAPDDEDIKAKAREVRLMIAELLTNWMKKSWPGSKPPGGKGRNQSRKT
jgi:hypothetical protein